MPPSLPSAVALWISPISLQSSCPYLYLWIDSFCLGSCCKLSHLDHTATQLTPTLPVPSVGPPPFSFTHSHLSTFSLSRSSLSPYSGYNCSFFCNCFSNLGKTNLFLPAFWTSLKVANSLYNMFWSSEERGGG